MAGDEARIEGATAVSFADRILGVASGLLAGLAGVALAVWPDVSLTVFSRLGGWVMAGSGLVMAVELARKRRLRSWSFAGAVAAGALGLVLVGWPDRTFLVATVLAGAWLIIDGMSRVFDTMAEKSVRQEVIGNLLGCGEAVLGVMVIARPVAGVRAAAIFFGAGLVMHGVARIRSAVASLETAS